jgi:hypothetical protein
MGAAKALKEHASLSSPSATCDELALHQCPSLHSLGAIG